MNLKNIFRRRMILKEILKTPKCAILYETRGIMEVRFFYYMWVSEKRKTELVKRIETKCAKLSVDMDVIKLVDFRFSKESKAMFCSFDCSLASLMLVVRFLGSYNFELSDMEIISESNFIPTVRVNIYKPTDNYYFMIKRHLLLIGDQVFQNPEEVEEFFELHKDKTSEELLEMNPPSKKSRNRLDALEAYHMSREESAIEIKRILESDPHCIEALICRTGWENDPEKRIDDLEEIIEISENVLGVNEADFEQERLWTDHTTKPYMKALELLGIELAQNGYLEEALEQFQEILELNPMDNQGIRYLILQNALVNKKLSICEQIFRDHSWDDSSYFLYSKAIYNFFKYGNKSKSKKAAIRAFEQNPYPVLFILDLEEPPTDIIGCKPGSPEEGIAVCQALLECYETQEKVILWLVKLYSENFHLGTTNEEEESGLVVPFGYN